MKTPEQIRAEFEASYIKDHIGGDPAAIFEIDEDGGYVQYETQICWQHWEDCQSLNDAQLAEKDAVVDGLMQNIESQRQTHIALFQEIEHLKNIILSLGEMEVVSGNAIHRTNPGSIQRLGMNASWLVSMSSNRTKLQKTADAINKIIEEQANDH
jgi:hypothetical protein